VGLIAHQIEAAGIPTLCMGAALDIMKAVNPPRGAFLDYPLGNAAGKPDQPELQREILVAALEAFSSLTEPGHIKMLPFQWDEDDSWKKALFERDERLERQDTPQYQDEEDRRKAESGEAPAMNLCGCETCTLPPAKTDE
jgi:D-proline reductase (dithiol) PrdB